MDDGEQSGGGADIGTRWPELVVATGLMGIALLVIFDSLRTGIGWADDGPRSGYFPFYIGLLLLVSSGTVLVSTLLAWRKKSPEVFARRGQLASVMAVLVPMVLYVAAIGWAGIYAASMVLIGYFMRRHGRYGWLLTIAVSVAVPLLFFLVFERWFLVLLPKGPIEHLLGF